MGKARTAVFLSVREKIPVMGNDKRCFQGQQLWQGE